MTRTYDLDELQRLDDECRDAAARLGMDVPEVVFHLAEAERIYDIAARGLPGRYPHWRFGRDYERMRLDHDHGRSRIYELVLNTDPYQAYLLAGNSWVAQLLVIAHVYGHCWFFANNRHFARADRKFLHRVRAGAERIEDYGRRHGVGEVEDFVDAVSALSLHAPVELRPSRAPEPPPPPADGSYDDLFPEERAQRQSEHQVALDAWRERVPREPQDDLLDFLCRHASRLEDWQRDVISIVREEAGYFLPQRRTKIANEGFAVWTHLQVVHEMQLPTDEFVEFDRLNAEVSQPHPLSVNPYNLGYELWREVERIYDHPTDEERERFPGAGEIPGRERVYELASVCDDASLVATYLTPAVCERCQLFAWKRESRDRALLRVTTLEADEVRDRLVADLSRLGTPRIVITDADVGRKGGLWLEHRHEGQALDREYAVGTLPYVGRLWGRTVCLESVHLVEGALRPIWYVCEPGETLVRVFTSRPAL